MTQVLTGLQFAARQGRWLLVLGLIAGVALPGLAAFMERQLPIAVALLLFFSALRVGPRQAIGATRDIGQSLYFVLALQLVLPILFVLLLIATGWRSPLAFGLALMLAASPISGSPSLTILLGKDGAPSLRLLIAATALLPLTTIPVFWMMPDLVGGNSVIGAALRLLLIIGLATAVAFAIRGTVLKNPGPAGLGAIDGLAALTMAIMVVGLMAAVRPALEHDPGGLAFNLAVAFLANFGLQVSVYLLLKRPLPDQSAGIAVCAGNRNIALFLAALPAGVMEPLLLFIGCYQVPMYLTPILLRRFYR